MNAAALTARVVLALLCSAAISACQTPQSSAPSETAPRTDQPPQPSQPVPQAAPAPSSPPPPIPRTEAEIRQLLDSARNLLDQGQEDAAASELEKVLSSDPGNKAANTLMRSIREDPTTLYGRESFQYRVAQGDTLALLAQRYLNNDRDQFYGLARYNGIKVPRQLHLGAVIRIPGKQRAPGPAPSPAPAPAPTPTPPPPAPAPTPAPAPPPTPAPPPPPPDPEVQRKAEVDRFTRRARALMARQDVCGAIAAWDEVLKIDPNNRTAILEREKALELKKKLPAAKC